MNGSDRSSDHLYCKLLIVNTDGKITT